MHTALHLTLKTYFQGKNFLKKIGLVMCYYGLYLVTKSQLLQVMDIVCGVGENDIEGRRILLSRMSQGGGRRRTWHDWGDIKTKLEDLQNQ
jgi:hypothetical protein